MNDKKLLRYSRQILLPEIGIEGQQTLLNSTLLLIGMGGLGAPNALYLAASGVGHLIIADFDQVELSNLARQVIHHTNDIGKDKVISAKEKMLAINPDIQITTLTDLSEDNIEDWVQKADIVLDGTDNFNTRFRINQACVTQHTPLVSAAVIRFEGQLSVFKGYERNQPCYQCLYPTTGNNDENCSNNGILAPVAGLLGTMQALQAIKVILNLGEQLTGKLMMVDALDLNFRTIKLSKDKHCPICNLSQ
ncbi:HesA/MoeB/ThiF family protein [Bathymodiolus thermophilus thioautotrophic gill symbiont]|uniref:Molybdopterin-synthase adenylyltransferase n=1 Tax=Bathymodiolus thermophilus thioautotrophic gill symbiont TaxID=2360 RepID=A0A1J5ULY4_9GAMM|nr:molybdopterin-synthase adenylyltransferase MoeB [Bathymodiolus thermophilus thioautotrophic gill symbiont]AYQ56852.1 Molybdopterin biosynthesis protein MoeB [Bathymodiolus thermophilus thioautotrophic gill symbiont]OIR25247.1 molybdopterin-synthase adenylyltransferase MoeB [Bathymodiolus thermophilus thioautotrophic gill symbiont]